MVQPSLAWSLQQRMFRVYPFVSMVLMDIPSLHGGTHIPIQYRGYDLISIPSVLGSGVILFYQSK